MKKRQVVLSEELFDKYQDRYFQTYEENKTLQREIGYLNALFDKEGDTQIIKYNGKLYRITVQQTMLKQEWKKLLTLLQFR